MIVCKSKKYILCEVYSFSSFVILLRKRLIVALRKNEYFYVKFFCLIIGLKNLILLSIRA